jgi:creatinine amidohydrolase
MKSGKNQTSRTRKLEELTWMEFKRLVPKKTDAVLLPVGTVEAHGVTALGTDNILPLAIAERIATQVNALIAPVIPYGITRSLLAYPGSTSVTPETFERYVYEVAASLVDAGFKRIAIVNGHGGNTEQLKNVCFRLYREKKVFCLVVDWWVHCSEEIREAYGHEGGHAGTDETGMMQALRPELVHKEFYKPDLACLAQPGVATSPFPGSIILYEKDEGYPDFDPARAAKLLELVCAKVERTILDIFRRWKTI